MGQHPQHPGESFTMGVQVDEASRPRDRGVIRRVLVQRYAHETPHRQRIRQPPGNPALRPDALEIPDQQRPKVNPRRQRRTPVLGRIELRTPLLDKLVEVLGLQQFIQALIKRMSRRRRQLRVRDPDVLLLLPLLARPHRHAPILRTKPVDTSEVFVYESGLAPRAPMRLIGFLEPCTQPFKRVFARTSTLSTCGGTANNSFARAPNAFAISPVKWALRPASFAPDPNYTLPMLRRGQIV